MNLGPEEHDQTETMSEHVPAAAVKKHFLLRGVAPRLANDLGKDSKTKPRIVFAHIVPCINRRIP